LEPSLPREPAHVRYARQAARLYQQRAEGPGDRSEAPDGVKQVALTPKVQRYLLALLDGRSEPEADALRILLGARDDAGPASSAGHEDEEHEDEGGYVFPRGANRR
jgi:hypothetical protein